MVLLETNLELKLRTVFLRECKLVSFHNSIFLFSGRFIGADGAVSTRTMSWSLMSGITLHFRSVVTSCWKFDNLFQASIIQGVKYESVNRKWVLGGSDSVVVPVNVR